MRENESRPHLVLFAWKDDYIEFLVELNIKVTLIQYPFLFSDKQKEIVSNIITIPMGEEQQVESLIYKLHEEDPISAMVSFYPTWLVFVSRLGEALNIKCNSLVAVENTRFKDRFREVLLNSQKRQIKWAVGSSPNDIELFFNKNENDIIVKPTAGGGSAGVFRMTSSDQAEYAFQHARDVPYWANMENNEGILLEEYIEGKEYSVETLSYDGVHKILAIIEKITTGPPSFIEIAHIAQADLTETQRENIEAVVFEMLSLVGQKNGPCHTEIKLKDDVPYIIESQTRFGGDQIWELVWLTTGYHAGIETIAHLCESSPLRKPPMAKAACVFHFIPEQEDVTILDIEGVEEAQNSIGVHKLRMKENLINKKITIKHNGDRLGFILTTGETREESLLRCVNAMGKIKLKTNLGYLKLKVNK